MVRYTHVFGRLGNKTNDIKFFKDRLPTDCKIVVEPFCGTCAISKYMSNIYNDLQYHLNDLDENIFLILNDIDGYIEFKKDTNNKYKDFVLNDDDTKYKYIRWKTYVENIDNKFTKIFVQENFIKGSMFRCSNVNPDPKDILLYNTAIKTNKDYIDIMEQYEDDKDAFLFIDPPYLFSDNSGYVPQKDDTDSTYIIVYLSQFLMRCKCKIMIIINDLKILRHLFGDYVKGDYSRTYQLSKKKASHLIITNY